jgi:two-component system, NtrC family, sensor kinase
MDSPVLERIGRELLLRKRLQEALIVFARGVSARLSLETGLAALAGDINGIFGARRTSIWLHDRRGRFLTLAASSDPRDVASLERISTAEDTPIARGMREDGVLVEGSGVARSVVAPLRGWRRALGTMVIEGEARALDDELLVELAMDLARQLSTAVESIVVLDELIRQHRLLADTFDSLADMVVVTDAQHRAVQVNSTLAERAGTPRSELTDRPLEDVVGPTIASWTGAQETGSREAATREFTGEDLAETIAATATPLVNQAGDHGGRVIVLRDITEQVRLRARLAQSEKLASLGQFIAGIAHEMNNPLQSVLGHLELMIDIGDHDTAHKSELRRIYHDADRAAKVVRNLLVFSGSSRAARRRLNVSKLLARVIAIRESAFQRPDVQMDVEGVEGLEIVGDGGLLQQALLNIVINAEQAIASHAGSGRILITTAAADHRVTITVEDSGPGIPPDVLPQIFDPFFTTKEVGEGTGLGLAIVYGVMQEHGGQITAAPSSLGGARFTLQLPAAE